MRTPINLYAFLLVASLAGIAQETPDRVNVPLTDPSRPAVVHASLMNGGITVTGYNGKEVIVEARARHEGAKACGDPSPTVRPKACTAWTAGAAASTSTNRTTRSTSE
jgi:hypothetical protein